MKKISQIFLQGLLALLPIAITLAVLFWLGSFAESSLGTFLEWLLPAGWYRPGMGVAAGLGFIFCIGILMRAYLFRKLGSLAETLLGKIPLVKTIYNSVRDLAKFASATRQQEELQKPVLVTLDSDIRVIGFITRKNFPVGGENLIAVYLPMSYQIGGYTLLLPESRLQMLDMSVADALRLVLTAAITQPESHR